MLGRLDPPPPLDGAWLTPCKHTPTSVTTTNLVVRGQMVGA